MKDKRLNTLLFLIIYTFLCSHSPTLKACDVSTYVAMLKAERDKFKTIPIEQTSKDIVIGYTEGTKYMSINIAQLFEKKKEPFMAFTEELDNLMPNTLSVNFAPTTITGKKADLVIVPALTNPQNNTLHHISDWAITFATDELILVFGGSGKHKETIKKLSWKEVVNDKSYTMVIATDEKRCLSHHTRALLAKINENWPAINTRSGIKNQCKILPVATAREIIEKVVKGEADYGFIYKSIAETYTMLTKQLPDEINQHESISYGFTILKDSPNYKSASLFAELLLSINGFLKLQATGLKAISGGIIEFKTR